MRFAKQRFVICVLFLSLPVLYFFALVQSPYVSETSLTWALKVARFRTGLKVDAQSWQVNVGSFSVSLSNFQLQEDSYSLRAPEVSFSVSPLGLLFGKLNMSRIDLVSPTLSGSLPTNLKNQIDSMFDSESPQTNSGSQKEALLALPNTVGKKVFNLSESLNKKNIRFESLRIQNLKILLDNIQLKNGSLEIENYGDGQARLQSKLEDFKIGKLSDTIKVLDLSISLVRSTRTDFFFLFPRINFEFGQNPSFFKLESNGRWPGLVSLRTQGHLNAITQFLAPNPKLISTLPNPLEGLVQSDFELTTNKNSFDSLKGKFSGRGLKLNRFTPNDVDIEFSQTAGDLKISQLRLVLPRDSGDAPEWRKEIESKNLRIDLSTDEKRISGDLAFSEVGLCGILIATGEQLCPVGLVFSGKIPVNGLLNPFKLDAIPELTVNETVVEGADISNFRDLKSPLLRLHPLKLQGPVEVFSDRIDLKDIKLIWSEKSVLGIKGDIAYDPLVLKLLAKGETMNLAEMLTEFLGLAPQGQGLLDSDVLYDERLNPKTGWTWVKGKLNLENVGVEGQNFGTLIGNVGFENLALVIGPLKLANGGGKAAINGKMTMDSKGNHLKLRADLDRLEIRSQLQGQTKEIFSGFVSGDLDFAGRLKKEDEDFFGGPIKFRMNNFSLFGIPFSKGNLRSRYKNGILFLDSIDAESRGNRVLASGLLHPEKGSRIDFSSENFPIAELNLGMGLDDLKEGNLRARGFWSRAEGWGIQGTTNNIRLGGKPFPIGNVNVSGNNEDLKINFSIPENIDLKLESLSGKGPNLLKLSLNELGIYGGFAFLKNWPSLRNVSTQGRLSVDWAPQQGRIETENLSIAGPSGREGLLTPFLEIAGKNEVSWKNGVLLKNTYYKTDQSKQLLFTGNSGDKSLGFSLNTHLAFLDLVVPNFQFFEGQLIATGTFPLNPNISSLVAQGELSNGTMQIRGLGLPIEQLKGKFNIASQILNFTEATGRMGTGDAKLSGGYRLSIEKPGASIKATLNKAQVIVMDDVPAEITGEMTITGEKVPYLLAGNVIVTNALYSKEFTAGAFTDIDRASPVLNFNIESELGSQTRVKNSLADVLLTGRMNLKGTDVLPEIKGRAKLGAGNFFANQNSFQVIQGTIDFPGGQPGTPTVNVQGNTLVKANNQDYRIELKVKGPGLDPLLEFSSDPTLPTQDIVSLLAFGLVRTDQGGLDANADLAGAARVEAFQALFGKTLGKGLDKTTGFQVQFRAAPDQAQKEFIPKVMVTRKLTDKVTASFGNSLDFAKPERNFQVDYNLLKNVNVTGVWEQGNENEDTSVGVDLRFKFDVK